MSTRQRYVQVRHGVPVLSPDVTRNLKRGRTRLTRDGFTDEVTIRLGQRAMRPYQLEVANAYQARNVDTGRPVHLDEFHRLFYQATELDMLRPGGKLAAWLLAIPGPVCVVLAAQMVPGFEHYRPGILVESDFLRRAGEAPECLTVDWGPGHTESLLATA